MAKSKLSIPELIDYFTGDAQADVAADTVPITDIVDDATDLVQHVAELRTALQNLLSASRYKPGCQCWQCLQQEAAWTAADKLLKGGE